MLVCVHLGAICVVIGLSLMFLVFFVYVFDKEKVVHICFITTELSDLVQGSYVRLWDPGVFLIPIPFPFY